MAAEPNRTEAFLKSEEVFRWRAKEIILEMVYMSEDTEEDTTPLVDEILHSIFFLGEIHVPQCSPRDILSDEEMFNGLKECYPRPFILYSSQVPKRSPFSSVLDMFVNRFGQQNEVEIKERLRELILRLQGDRDKTLLASTICVSQIKNQPDAVRYYGVSMSTTGQDPGRIMVAASCLSAWEECVADAVMTYCPDSSKKTYFDGTFKLPSNVRCEAFSLISQEPMRPCRPCGHMFGLTSDEIKKWPYGNCAEVESLSNLLRKEGEVKEQVKETQRFSADNKRRAKDKVQKDLRRMLKIIKFNWDNEYYTPVQISPYG